MCALLLYLALLWPALISAPAACASDHPKNQSQQQQTAPDNRGTYDVPFIVKQLPREHSAEEEKQEAAKAELDGKLAGYTADLAAYTKWLFAATLMLAVLTGALAIAAFRQMKDSRRSITAAERAASAAESALTVVERAFITVDGLGLQHATSLIHIGRVKIKNTGNLPARRVRWIVHGEISEDPRRKIFCIKEKEIQPSTNIIAPRSDMVRYTDYRFNSIDIEAVRGAFKVLYIWGIVYYWDSISPKERWTRFCHRYEADCMRIDVILHERVRQHQFGNGTDEDEQTETS
jgi:hypothetical protein